MGDVLAGWRIPSRLLEAARDFYERGGTPVAARVAATVLLVRGGANGVEVYLLRRAASMAFASGVYAFPGGAVDPRDSSTEVRWSGPDEEVWGDRLGVPPATAQAIVCAAVREVFEETGVLLAGGDADSVVGADLASDGWEADRRALAAHERAFADLLRDRELVLRGDLVVPWNRWITPEFEPRRYDTYFFLAALPPGQESRDVSGEADHTMWITPEEAVRRFKKQDLKMFPPTAQMVSDLAEWARSVDTSDIAAAVATTGAREAAVPVTPRIEFGADGTARMVRERAGG